MKSLFTIAFLLFFTSVSNAQSIKLSNFPIDSITNKVSFSEVVTTINNKDILYKNAQAWIAKTFGDYKAVIQLEDKDAGILLVKGSIRTTDEPTGIERLFFSLRIDLKDKKYRYKLTDLTTNFSNSFSRSDDRNAIEKSLQANKNMSDQFKDSSTKRLNNFINHIDLIILSLKKAMVEQVDF